VDSYRSIDWAGRNGLRVIMWIPTIKALKERFEVYRKARSEAENRSVPLGEGISLVRDMFVADSMDEARDKAAEGLLTYLRWIAHWRGLGNHLNPDETLLTYEFSHPRKKSKSFAMN
jgi:alkanesulfonate monooxygenase SsuD/methylene tetrahydromethanopterin reductase-like flavin-dependent oxidoreductase (luciferase family)